MSSPRFAPLLIPETSRSIFFPRRMPLTPRLTQSVDGIHPRRDLLHPQRVGERQRMGGRAPLPVGRDDVDGAQLLQGLGQRDDPLGAHAVVVRNENHGSAVGQGDLPFFPWKKGLRERVS
jgi:hypothetical protein